MTETVNNTHGNDEFLLSQYGCCNDAELITKLARLCKKNISKDETDLEFYRAYKSVARLYLDISEEFFIAENEIFSGNDYFA